MKYATPLLGLAILVASVLAAAAAPRIPAQYHGTWCWIEPHNADKVTPPTKWTYKRCREVMSEGDFVVRASDIRSPEANCKLINIVALHVGHRVQAECVYVADGTPAPDQSWPMNVQWHLSDDGRYLMEK
jgi:hypothetical protein